MNVLSVTHTHAHHSGMYTEHVITLQIVAPDETLEEDLQSHMKGMTMQYDAIM